MNNQETKEEIKREIKVRDKLKCKEWDAEKQFEEKSSYQ